MKQKQRYEELKWKEAPLYYHNNTTSDSTSVSANGENHYKRRLPLTAETTALLIVDVQPEYWSHCPSVRKDFADFPQQLARLVETCRQRRAKIIWVRADYRHVHSPWLVQFERLRGKAPDFRSEVPCEPLSKDFTWEHFAVPVGGEVIIPKQSWSSTSDTALKEVLRVSGMDTVLVCGLITSVCVQHSAFGVFEAGYRTLLVTDACADRGRARHEAALALYGDYMYELVTCSDLQDGLLLPAKPQWLTLPKSSRNSSNVVSPLNSFGDLQNALEMSNEEKEESSTDPNEMSTPPSSMTSRSEWSNS